MENNQQKNTPVTPPGFENQQPGQQLPSENKEESNEKKAAPSSAIKEQHSDWSKPENSDETLGTP